VTLVGYLCRHKNCKAVIETFKSIVNVLQEEVEEKNDRDVIVELLVNIRFLVINYGEPLLKVIYYIFL